MPSLSILKKRLRPRIIGAAALMSFAGCLSVDAPFDGVALLTIISGNEQNVNVNTAAAQPLVVRAYDNAAQPMVGVNVDWTVATGGTISASTSTTDATGSTQVNFTAGANAGPVQVRATADGLTVTFTMQVITGT